VRDLELALARVEEEEVALWEAGADPTDLLLKRVDVVALQMRIAQVMGEAGEDAA
jgi:hypothetical protein